jgi:hypothetical protein
MNGVPDRQRRRVRWRFLLALIVAIAGLAVRYIVLPGGAKGTSVQTLSGITSSRTRIDLGVRGHHVVWLRTSLRANCAGGTSWRQSWSPVEGNPVYFTTHGRSFVTHENASPSFSGGIVGHVGFAIRGTLTGRDSAQGTIRLVARFYRGERQWNACDTLDVRWAVGAHASARLKAVPVGHPVSAYYPAVPSLASDVSPARLRFIGLVDSVCVRTYNELVQAEARAAVQYRYFVDHVLRDSTYAARLHAWQLRSIVDLGQPPQAQALYNAWLADFRHRVSVELQAVALYAQKHHAAALRNVRSLDKLKARGNLLGQRFGLVRCTSSGDRTPVPVLSDEQPVALP